MSKETLIEKLRGYKSTPRHCEELCYEAANVIESMIQKLIAAQEASEFDHSEYRRLRAELCQQLASRDAELATTRRAFNSAINHAISLGIEAGEFLQCWREGDWAGCAEFGFSTEAPAATKSKEQGK